MTNISSITDINKVKSESEMPVKYFILLVIYLLVPLASNFARNTHLPANCISRATHIC